MFHIYPESLKLCKLSFELFLLFFREHALAEHHSKHTFFLDNPKTPDSNE